MNDDISMASMCQGSRLLGMSKSDEHTLESYLRGLVRNNGPEFVIDKLKTLKTETIRELENPAYDMPSDQVSEGYTSTAWNHRLRRPKGPLSTIYKTWNKPSNRVRGIGMLINTITLDHASDKQIQKFVDGVNVDGRFADNNYLPITEKEMKIFVSTVDKQLHSQELYSGLDLTGSLIPDGNVPYSIADAKRNLSSDDPSRRHQAIADLSWAYDSQWKTAPRFVTDYIRTNFASFHGVHVHKNTGMVARDYEFSSKYRMYGRNATQQKYIAGTVSFLQKPGGKLRSVINTNRVINYALKPYAKGVEKAFYDLHPHHIFVKRQDKGKESISQMLRRGHTLVSADLTSATDRLNFRSFTNGIRKSIIDSTDLVEHQWQITANVRTGKSTRARVLSYLSRDDIPYYTKDRSKELMTMIKSSFRMIPPDDLKYFEALESVNLFEEAAEQAFYSEDLDTALSFKTGQPLGMMGSFQTLTAMNFCMGREAERTKYGRFTDNIPSFAVVGDDFVGVKSIMTSYSDIVRANNGLDNHEKALQSSKYAEFCSHLITRDRVIPMKPRFHVGHDYLWLNANKTSVHNVEHVYRLSASDKEALEALAAYGDPEGTLSDNPATSHRYPRSERLYIENALKQLSFESQSSPDPITVSRETETLSRDVAPHRPDVGRGETDFRIWTPSSDGRVEQGYARQVSGYKDNQYSTVIDHYDHNKGQRAEKQSLRKQAKLAKETGINISKIHKSLTDNSVYDLGLKPHHSHTKIKSDDLAIKAIISEDDLKNRTNFVLREGAIIETINVASTNKKKKERGKQSASRDRSHVTNDGRTSQPINSERNSRSRTSVPFPSAKLDNDYNNKVDRSRNRLPYTEPKRSNMSRSRRDESHCDFKTIPTPWSVDKDVESPDNDYPDI